MGKAAGALQATPRRGDSGQPDAPGGASQRDDNAAGEEQQQGGMEPARHGPEEVGKRKDEEQAGQSDGGPQRWPDALPKDGEAGKTQAQRVGETCVRPRRIAAERPLAALPGRRPFDLAFAHATPRARSSPLS